MRTFAHGGYFQFFIKKSLSQVIVLMYATKFMPLWCCSSTGPGGIKAYTIYFFWIEVSGRPQFFVKGSLEVFITPNIR